MDWNNVVFFGVAIINLLVGMLLLTGKKPERQRGLGVLFIGGAVINVLIRVVYTHYFPPVPSGDPYYYQLFLAGRYVGYLLLVYAFYYYFQEKKLHLQVLTAAMVVAVAATALFTPGNGIWFYPARFIMFAVMSAYIGKALKDRSPVLLYITILAGINLIADLIKFPIRDGELIYRIQQVVDPILNYGLLFLLLAALLWQRVRDHFYDWAANTVTTETAPQTSSSTGGTVVPFPSDDRLDFAAMLKESHLDHDMEEVDELFAKLASVATVSKKDYLNPADLAVYLGIEEKMVDNFIKTHDIRKIYLDKGRKAWVVDKKQVKEALSNPD